jgi:hypothetical protein
VSKPEEKNRAKNKGEEEKFSELGLYFFSWFFFFLFFTHTYFSAASRQHTKQREYFYKQISRRLRRYTTHTFSPTTNQGLTKQNHVKKTKLVKETMDTEKYIRCLTCVKQTCTSQK